MDIDWNAIIWFIIWAAVIIGAAIVIVYAAFCLFAVRQFKKFSRDFR